MLPAKIPASIRLAVVALALGCGVGTVEQDDGDAADDELRKVCPSDENPCTREFRASGRCVTRPVEDGTPCAGGSCQAGSCVPAATTDSTPPEVTILSPADGATVAGVVSIAGMARDDSAVALVEVQVDSAAFAPATGTTSWSYALDTRGLAGGPHALTVRATDLHGLTGSARLAVSIANAAEPSEPTSVPTGAVYYVSKSGSDSNPGTESQPWATIAHAAALLRAGETVLVGDGVYTEGSLSPANSGTADKRITFKSRNKWGALISSTAGLQCAPTWSIKTSYVTVQDFDHTVAVGTACTNGSSADTTIRCWPSGMGCHAIGLRESSSLHWGSMKTNQSFALFEGNVSLSGITTFNTDGVVIRNNTISLPAGTPFDGTGSKGGSRNTRIYDNVFRIANDGGIYLGGDSCLTCGMYDASASGSEGYNEVFYNNVVIKEGGGTVSLTMLGCRDCAFVNNVVLGGTIQTATARDSQMATVNPRFENNIIDCRGANAQQWGLSYQGALTVDHNLFRNCTNVPAQAHAVTGDPLFVNAASDWHLSPGSPALGSGSVIQFMGFDGNPIDVSLNGDGVRRTAPWNLGIY